MKKKKYPITKCNTDDFKSYLKTEKMSDIPDKPPYGFFDYCKMRGKLWFCCYDSLQNKWICYPLPMGCFHSYAQIRIHKKLEEPLKRLYDMAVYNDATLNEFGNYYLDINIVCKDVYDSFLYVNRMCGNKANECGSLYEQKCYKLEDAILDRLDIIVKYLFKISQALELIISSEQAMVDKVKAQMKHEEEVYKIISSSNTSEVFFPFSISENLFKL